MKKKFLIPVFALLGLCLVQACEKLDFPVQPATYLVNVAATMNEDTTYTYALPFIDTANTSMITRSATHASFSQVSTDINGKGIYQYTPAKGYVGTDSVMISTSGTPDTGSSTSSGITHTTPAMEFIVTNIVITIKGK